MLEDFLYLIYSLKVLALLKNDTSVSEGHSKTVMRVFTALAIGFKFLSTISREMN